MSQSSSGPEPSATSWSGGHTVLAVPVPPLEDWVRARTGHHDASFVGSPGFANAHITVLGPWISEPDAAELATVARIAADEPAFDFGLHHLAVFPDGVIHLVPEPSAPFRRLTSSLAQAFPDHPPYGGRFGEVSPHLTLDAVAPGVDLASTAHRLGDLIPADCRAERIDLQWWANDDCHTLASWPLGAPRTR